jgi:creatinine amidohydrolase
MYGRELLYEVYGPKTLLEMSWLEVEEALQVTDIALLPLGSTENHGPHLPLGSDTFQGTDFARRVLVKLEERGIRAVAAPCMPFGVNYHMLPFPGSLHVSADTLRRVILDVGASLVHHGFRKLALIMGHGGNFATMQVAAQELAERHGCRVLALNWLPYLTAHYHEILTSGQKEGHAGEGETARMLVSTPRLVRLDRARAHYPAPPSRPIEADQHPVYGGGVFRALLSYKEVTPYGNVGDPARATREAGERIYELCCEWMADVIAREFGPAPSLT